MNKFSHKYNVILDNMDLTQYRLKPLDAMMYVQDCFARYCALKGIAAYDLFKYNLFWVISDFNIEFIDDLPFWSEEIEVEIWFSEILKIKAYTDFVIKHRGKIFAKGNLCWYILSQETRRPVKVDEILKDCEILPELTLGEHTKFNLPEIKNKISENTHITNLSDVDFNEHVNNKSYINIASMTANEGFRKSHTLKNMKVRFVRESYLGDILNCSAYVTDIPNSYVHILEKDGESVCEIVTTWSEYIDKTNIVDYDLCVKTLK